MSIHDRIFEIFFYHPSLCLLHCCLSLILNRVGLLGFKRSWFITFMNVKIRNITLTLYSSRLYTEGVLLFNGNLLKYQFYLLLTGFLQPACFGEAPQKHFNCFRPFLMAQNFLHPFFLALFSSYSALTVQSWGGCSGF